MSQGTREPLTRERIISAAVEIVDEGGFGALSMRKLGAAVGVEAMSLYNHVDNKEDVLDGILDAVLREVPPPDPDLPWDERLRELAHGFRRVGLAHPGVLPLFNSRRILTAEAFSSIAGIHGILLEAGFDEECALDAFVFVASFITGYLQIDMGRITMIAAGRVTDYASWDRVEHPGAVELGLGLVARDWNTEFDRCIDLMLSGLTALLVGARADHA
ncbi:MAG TPA: TetR/AcrR family transcriptional regulator C-terminal domain-containing protein [Acidimicrobiales bacterium]|nr:TetR/AcrR family transcriptional regulator C-terminal domain-containing protein [Acidimicrobiales bacterium]